LGLKTIWGGLVDAEVDDFVELYPFGGQSTNVCRCNFDQELAVRHKMIQNLLWIIPLMRAMNIFHQGFRLKRFNAVLAN